MHHKPGRTIEQTVVDLLLYTSKHNSNTKTKKYINIFFKIAQFKHFKLIENSNFPLLVRPIPPPTNT